MNTFNPKFIITNRMTAAITQIELQAKALGHMLQNGKLTFRTLKAFAPM
mgnify:CR=1 FL=1